MLGQDAFDAAWAEGWRLSIDEALLDAAGIDGLAAAAEREAEPTPIRRLA